MEEWLFHFDARTPPIIYCVSGRWGVLVCSLFSGGGGWVEGWVGEVALILARLVR